jgi:competence protein ComEA
VQVIEQTENGPLSLNSKQFEGCININQATIEELQGLPGIGSVIAKRIYDDRMGRGAYHSIDELLKVKGIGLKKLDRLRPFVKIK